MLEFFGPADRSADVAFLAAGNVLLPTSIAILAFALIWNASRGSLSEMVVTNQESG
ncbi:MAG TPA: hypothetical protein VIH03_03030 [Nitrososphaerales archaeon]